MGEEKESDNEDRGEQLDSTYKIPRPIKPIMEILVLRLICTFHSRGIGLEEVRLVKSHTRVLGAIQESCHPVGKDVHSSASVVHIGKNIACLAVASICEGLSAPRSSATRSAPMRYACSCGKTHSTGIQLIRIKIRAMMFIITNVAMTAYWM